MPDLIVLALSNLCVCLLTAWVIHRARENKSPIPSIPERIEVSDEEPRENGDETYQPKGRIPV